MIFKYQDIEMADEFLDMLFSDSISERAEFIEDTFLDTIIHKCLIDKYEGILPKLYSITTHLIKNSSLKVVLTDKIIKLFTLAALSVCVMDDMDFLKENKFKKSDYEIELKSILEELKLNGVGNGLVRNLADIYKAITDMSSNLFKTKKIFEIFSKPNFLHTIDSYIQKYSLSINNISSYFDKIFNVIHTLYIKPNKLDTKLASISQNNNKVKSFVINEFNL